VVAENCHQYHTGQVSEQSEEVNREEIEKGDHTPYPFETRRMSLPIISSAQERAQHGELLARPCASDRSSLFLLPALGDQLWPPWSLPGSISITSRRPILPAALGPRSLPDASRLTFSV